MRVLPVEESARDESATSGVSTALIPSSISLLNSH